MLVCKCATVDDTQIERSIRDHGLRTREEVTLKTRAGAGCTSCHAEIERLLGIASMSNTSPPTPAD